MKALLFAAGRGERMRPLTDTTPKPLLHVGGMSLIEWHIQKLARAGIVEIVINHAWLGEKIEAELGNGSRYGVNIQYSREPHALETAGGVAFAREKLGDDYFCAIAADVYSDYDYANLIRICQICHVRSYLAYCVLVPNPSHHPEGDFVLQNELLRDTQSDGTPTYTFSGIGMYHPALFQHIAVGQSAKLAPLLRAAMLQQKVGGELFTGRWTDVGTVARLHALDAELKNTLTMTLSPFPRTLFKSRIVPVIVISNVAQAVPLAYALLEGGIDVMEITLRHAAGLAAIEAVAKHVPQMCVGAGTVTRATEMAQVRNAGARFALSPGCTSALVQAALDCSMPFIPGAMTPSEVMAARDFGFGLLKLFPAAQAGGLAMLKALAGPLGDMQFCPTGGVNLNNASEFLQQPNVAMVGGSWLTPLNLVETGGWADITRLAREAQAISHSATPTPSP